MAWKDLDTTCRQALIDLYGRGTLTVDDLPYTPEFDRMCAEFYRVTGHYLSPHDFWRALATARKTGVLVRKER